MLKLEVGQTVWVKKSGNAIYHMRSIPPEERNPEDYIMEAKVGTVGRKWFTLGDKWPFGGRRFSLEDGGVDAGGYSRDYWVHLTKQEILDGFERGKELDKLWKSTSRYGGSAVANLTLDQLRRINAIIEEGKSAVTPAN